jgi:serralysin
MTAPVEQKPFTGNIYVGGILWGGNYWDQSNNGHVIEYSFWNAGTESFDNDFDDIATDASDWFDYEKAAMHQALQLWSNVANLNFVQSPDNDSEATLAFYSVDSSQEDSLGSFNPPDELGEGIGYFNCEDSSWTEKNLRQGGYAFITLIHELGHGLGLAHPHDHGGGSPVYPGVSGKNDRGKFGLNQGVWTTMSYVDGLKADGLDVELPYGYQGTPMAFDIAAVQYLYGANTSYNTDNDVYQLPQVNASGTFYSCLWDASGVDEISNAGSNRTCTINLNAAPLVGKNAGGFISSTKGRYGGFTIAHGVVIENATGGKKNDTLIGNGADNILNGSFGADRMRGGAGNDIYIVDKVRDKINEASNGGTDRVNSSVNYILDANLEYLTLTGKASINGTGNNLNNIILGNKAANILNGGKGADTMNGGKGSDILYGGAGDDYLVGGNGKDQLYGDEGNDTLTGDSGADTFGFNSPGKKVDLLTDFSLKDDTIAVSAAGFGGGLVANAAITPAQFVIGSAATTADHRFIYNNTNGFLFFDRDGLGASAQVQIASLNTGLAMTNNDIFVVA